MTFLCSLDRLAQPITGQALTDLRTSAPATCEHFPREICMSRLLTSSIIYSNVTSPRRPSLITLSYSFSALLPSSSPPGLSCCAPFPAAFSIRFPSPDTLYILFIICLPQETIRAQISSALIMESLAPVPRTVLGTY